MVHASKGMSVYDYTSAYHLAIRLGITIPERGTLLRGGIVGTARLVDCISSSEDPWFFGKYGFVIAKPQPVEFVPCKGALGFFDPGIQL